MPEYEETSGDILLTNVFLFLITATHRRPECDCPGGGGAGGEGCQR